MPSLLRRSPHLVFFWKGHQLVIKNYVTRQVATAEPIIIDILRFFDAPRPATDLLPLMAKYPAKTVMRLVEKIKRFSLLEEITPTTKASDRDFDIWDRWGLEAKLFHWSTKDVQFVKPQEFQRLDEARKAEARVPPAFKRYSNLASVSLPPAITEIPATFIHVLKTRRTERDFDGRPITLEHLATLLKLTWGVSEWVDSSTFGRIGLKTSPSGGARYPIEVYIAVHNVVGLKQGLYHYSPDRHRLHVIHEGSVKDRAERRCGNQWWTGKAAALFIMTAVFERTMWRYRSGRALRTIYLEAGHLCQTFCLTATALGLAPFCTAAFADSMLERDLGLNGIRESVLYVAAAGHVHKKQITS